jgi:hypothetical protein
MYRGVRRRKHPNWISRQYPSSKSRPVKRTSSTPTARPDVETLIRGAAASIIALYVIGLLAVNGYLFSLGVSDFTLVRARFIYTGSLITGFALFAFLIPSFSFWRLTNFWRNRSSLGTLRKIDIVYINVLRLLLPTLIFWTIFAVLQGVLDAPSFPRIFSSSSGDELYGKPLRDALLVGIAGLLLGLGIVRLWRTWGGGIRGSDALTRAGSTLMLTTGAILLFGAYLLVFMTTVYRQMPEQFGGGQPRSVRILFDKDSIDGVRELGVPIAPRAHASLPVNLMYVGSETYVLELQGGQILQVNRDLVSAVMTRNQ